jgi:serine protease Do
MQGVSVVLRRKCLFKDRLPTWILLLVVLGMAQPLAPWPAGASAEAAEAVPQVAPPKDVGELRAIENQVKKLVGQVLAANVAVRVGQSQGSGVVVSEDGYVLTAGHVMGRPGQSAVFIFADGKTVRGTTLGIRRRFDAGLAKITDPGPWPFVEMGRSADQPLGAWCVAVGHPLGYQQGRPPVVRVGRVTESQKSVIQTDCPLVAGDSGGPLFDLEGKVIGINSRIATLTTMNFHVPVDVYRESWDRLVKGEAWDEGIPGKNSREVKTAFRQAVAQAGACVVRVRCDGKDAALGTIVGPDGWVLTKASELSGQIVCRDRGGRQHEARIVGVHPEFDLAMLKIDATGLPIIPWSKETDAAVGQWVATPGVQDGTPLAVGVVGAPRRRIPPTSGVLGVAVADAEGGAKIERVMPDSAAQKAGLQVDDVITHVNGEPTPDHVELVTAIKEHQPGEVVRLTVKRGDQDLQISATLTELETPASRKRDMQNRSDVGLSRRHDDFPMVLQHDSVLRPVDCGGPVVDLSGNVIGVNIARGGRTETYAVPSDVLLTLMYDLISGRMPPPKPEPEPKPEPKPEAKPEPKPEPKPGPKPEPKLAPKPEPERKPEPKPESKPEPKAEPKPEPKPEPESEPKPPPKPEPDTDEKPEPEPKQKPESPSKPEPQEKPPPDQESPAEKKPDSKEPPKGEEK